MAPEVVIHGHGDENARPSSNASDSATAEAALRARLSRKRTKTGCLTCRKRRIKCGEERPVCRNCVKSKRHCDGYNQRVIFKPPTFEYQSAPNGGAHITFQAGPILHHETHTSYNDSTIFAQSQGPPQDQQYVTVFDTRLQQYVFIPQPLATTTNSLVPISNIDHAQPQPSFAPEHHAQMYQSTAQPIPPLEPSERHPQPLSVAMTQQPTYPTQSMLGVDPFLATQEPKSARGMPVVSMPPTYVPHGYGQGQAASQDVKAVFSSTPCDNYPHGQQDWQGPGITAATTYGHVAATPTSTGSSHAQFPVQTPIASSQHQWETNTYVPRPELAQPIDYRPPVQDIKSEWGTQHEAEVVADYTTPEFYEYEVHAPPNESPGYLLSSAAVETLDDDYYDVGSDEEMDSGGSVAEHRGHDPQRALSRILAVSQINARDLQMRRYDTFIYQGILDHYRVEEAASPLKNPATARVFAHFIAVTGPSLSIFERHPRNTSVLFAESSVPLSQQGLWTYRMPMAALRNQGLLHAMLALASLHIARLQNASLTPSMQHYAWALRRVHASVGNPKSRLKVTTIAASMLLGFYEIMTADHLKWNMHLAGSKQLVVETDFTRMTREFGRLKTETAARLRRGEMRRHRPGEPFSHDDLLDQIPDIDERMVSQLTGQEVRYDDHGRVEVPVVNTPPSLDLSKFEILKDLYWWYCKQDVYQSIISGNPLLMGYSRYADCPPRAPLGRGDAVYGSFDHLVLILGRIADFAARDRERKLRQVAVNGGQWRPAPGMNVPRPPQHQLPPTPVAIANSQVTPGSNILPPLPPNQRPMPQFYGMAPPPRFDVNMPASYTPSTHAHWATPQSNHPEHLSHDTDLQNDTLNALSEYGRIRSALHAFSSSLGPAFDPLTSEYQTPLETAFGTAHFYRSYDIGCLWAVYNMAVIIAIRSHPHMPPAAHVAAAVAARETDFFANEIGRIAAGIVPGPAHVPLNPALGAALCESCMPSFFAAVQYHDARQRHETVTRIFGIAKRTGWGSAELIANGCETAWVKAAEAGRGPPYERVVRGESGESEDPRLNGSWEGLDPDASPEEGDEGDRRLVRRGKKGARLQWAFGVMGVEEDVDQVQDA